MACSAGGDATACQIRLRDFVYRMALAAGLSPEREEPGLLPADPRRRPGSARVALDFTGLYEGFSIRLMRANACSLLARVGRGASSTSGTQGPRELARAALAA